MLSLADSYSGLLNQAVGLTVGEASLLEDQRHALAEMAELVAALRRAIVTHEGTIEDKDGTIMEQDCKRAELEATVSKQKRELERATRARELAQKEAAKTRELRREKAELEQEQRESHNLIRRLRDEVETAAVESKKYKKLHEMEALVSADLYAQDAKSKEAFATLEIEHSKLRDSIKSGKAVVGGPGSAAAGSAATDVPASPSHTPSSREKKLQKDMDELEDKMHKSARELKKKMAPSQSTVEDVLDGGSTAAMAVVHETVDNEEGDAMEDGADEMDGADDMDPASRLAMLQLKRLHRQKEQLGSRHERYAHRMQDATEEHAKLKADLEESAEQELSAAEQSEIQRKLELAEDKLAFTTAEDRRCASEIHAHAQEIQVIDDAFFTKKVLYDVLHALFTSRLERLGKVHDADQKRLAAVAATEDGLRTTLKHGQPGRKTEDEIFFKLGELQVQQRSIDVMHQHARDGQTRTRADLEELTGLAAAQDVEQSERTVYYRLQVILYFLHMVGCHVACLLHAQPLTAPCVLQIKHAGKQTDALDIGLDQPLARLSFDSTPL